LPLNYKYKLAFILLIVPFLLFAKKKRASKEGSDAVLKSMCIGMEAFYQEDYLTANSHFEFATTTISGVWGDSPDAKKARSLWYDEKVKPFKGEPYERMMAFYYYGLLFLQKCDFGNAQACFRQSVMQDAFAEEDQHRADAVLPLFLQGWALQAQGSINPAIDAYSLVKKHRPDFILPSIEKQPNVLLIVETGKSPRKVADGVGSYPIISLH